MDLGNIRSRHVFRACGLNSELYHLEIPQDATADGEHLEEPARQSPLPQLNFSEGHLTLGRGKKLLLGVSTAFIAVSSTMPQPETSTPRSWGPQDQRNEKSNPFTFLYFYYRKSRPQPQQLTVLRPYLTIWHLSHPSVSPGYNPGDQLSGGTWDPYSQNSKNLLGVGSPGVPTILFLYCLQVKSTMSSGNSISVKIQRSLPHAYSLRYFHTHSIIVLHLKPQCRCHSLSQLPMRLPIPVLEKPCWEFYNMAFKGPILFE